MSFIDKATEEKSKDFKAIVTEPLVASQPHPYDYAAWLAEGVARPKGGKPGDARPSDSMCWQFFVGTLDGENRNISSNTMFARPATPTSC